MLRHSFTALASLCLLAGCDSISDINFFGNDEPAGPTIDGERLAVLAEEDTLEADRSLDETPIELAAVQENSEWPQHAGSLAGFATTLTLNKVIENSDKVKVGEGAKFSEGTVVAPIVAAGQVFAMDAEGKISAHEADDIDEVLWVSQGVANAEERSMIGGGLAFANGTLYVVSGNGLVASFDPASGRELWRQDILIPVRAAPLVANGKVFVVTADSKLFALDAATGDPIWEDHGLSEGASFLANAAPVFNNGLLAIPYASAELKVVTADEGRPLWSDVLALTRRSSADSDFSGIGGAPVITENAVYAVSNAGVLAAYRLDNGLRVWEQPISSSNRPWVSGNVVFVMGSDGQLSAINRIDGRIFWVKRLPTFSTPELRLGPYRWSGPVLAGNTLYVVGSHGVLKRFNALTSKQLEDIDIPDDILTSPVIAGGRMYLMDQNAKLHVLY